MIDDKDINIDQIVKAAKLLTIWSRVTRYTISIQKDLYDELQMRVAPLMVGATSTGLVELVVLPRLKAISDLKGRFRLFEQSDYEPVLCRDSTRVKTE